jgi:acyl-CoA synthetase (NDP forming)
MMTNSENAVEALQGMFNARSVALVGASSTPGKFGYHTLETLINGGYKGQIYPINPKADRIKGLKVYPSITDIPGAVELAVVVVPAPFVPGVLREAAAKGVSGAAVLSAGFRESGFPDREAEIAAISKELGLRFLGPNIQGFTYVPNKLCATFFPVITKVGPMAVIGQSGSVTAALAEWADHEGLGITGAINLGNQTDLCESDVLEFFGQDEHTRAIALYVEGVKDGRRFLDVASRIAQTKPIAVLKSGRSEVGRRSAASHTGSLGGSDEVFSAACQQHGIVRANDLETLYDAAKALATLGEPRGNRVLVISTSGGGNTLAADEAEKHGLVVPPLPEALKERLDQIGLPPNATVSNPLDLAMIEPEPFKQAITIADQFDIADIYLIVFGDPVEGGAEAVKHLAAHVNGCVAVAYFGGGATESASRVEIQEAGIPVFAAPERAARGIGAAVWATKYRRSLRGNA